MAKTYAIVQKGTLGREDFTRLEKQLKEQDIEILEVEYTVPTFVPGKGSNGEYVPSTEDSIRVEGKLLSSAIQNALSAKGVYSDVAISQSIKLVLIGYSGGGPLVLSAAEDLVLLHPELRVFTIDSSYASPPKYEATLVDTLNAISSRTSEGGREPTSIALPSALQTQNSDTFYSRHAKWLEIFKDTFSRFLTKIASDPSTNARVQDSLSKMAFLTSMIESLQRPTFPFVKERTNFEDFRDIAIPLLESERNWIKHNMLKPAISKDVKERTHAFVSSTTAATFHSVPKFGLPEGLWGSTIVDESDHSTIVEPAGLNVIAGVIAERLAQPQNAAKLFQLIQDIGMKEAAVILDMDLSKLEVLAKADSSSSRSSSISSSQGDESISDSGVPAKILAASLTQVTDQSQKSPSPQLEKHIPTPLNMDMI